MTATAQNRQAVAAQVIRASVARMHACVEGGTNVRVLSNLILEEGRVLDGVADELETGARFDTITGSPGVQSNAADRAWALGTLLAHLDPRETARILDMLPTPDVERLNAIVVRFTADLAGQVSI